MPVHLSAASVLREREAVKLDDYGRRILDAALEQLLEFGLQRTSLERIARAAGVSRQTLFNRFPNRDALMNSVFVRVTRAFIADLDAQIVGSQTPEDRLVGAMVAGVGALKRHRLLHRLLITDRDRVLPYLTTGAGGHIEVLREYVAGQLVRAHEEGMPLSGDPEVLGELLVRIGHSIALTPDTKLPLDDAEQLERLVRQSILPFLQGRPADAQASPH
jgi:AcrR family transcriptional regulator